MPTRTDHEHGRALWTALVVTALWSSSWVLIRVVLDDESIPPITFAGLRYGVAAVVLIVWTGSNRTHRHQLATLRRPALAWLVLLGVVFVAVTQGAQFVAIDNQPAATTSLVLATTAFFVGLFSARSLGERSSARQLTGAVLIFIGAASYLAGDLGATTAGMAAALVGLAANVAGALLGRSVNRRHHDVAPVVVTAVSMSAGALLLLGTGLALDGVPSFSAKGSLIILWLAVVNTAVAFTLWNHSLRHLSAFESSAINNTMLIQIAGLAWIFLDEGPGALGLTGLATASFGLFLTQTGFAGPANTADESAHRQAHGAGATPPTARATRSSRLR